MTLLKMSHMLASLGQRISSLSGVTRREKGQVRNPVPRRVRALSEHSLSGGQRTQMASALRDRFQETHGSRWSCLSCSGG